MSSVLEAAKKSFFAHPQALVDSDQIGDRTRVWAFAHVMAGAQIGSDCNVGEHAYIEGGARLGNNVTVKNGVSIWSGITVEDNVFLGPHCVLTNDPNPRAYIKKSADSLVSTLTAANARPSEPTPPSSAASASVSTHSSAPAQWLSDRLRILPWSWEIPPARLAGCAYAPTNCRWR